MTQVSEPMIPFPAKQPIFSLQAAFLVRQGNGLAPAQASGSLPAEHTARWVEYYLFPAILFAVQFAAFSYLAFNRLVDSDEGFYLYISKLVFTKGTVLYRDVFYQQMPLLPYLYGAWMKIFGFGWESGRALSAFMAAIMGTFLFRHIYKTSGTVWLALSALLLYVFNLSALLFFLTAKTYVLSTALLFGGMLLGLETNGQRDAWRSAVSGLLVAFSIQTRLFFVVAAPVMAIWFWRRSDPDGNRKPFLLFLGGLAFGFVPSLVFIAIAPEQFIYDNILYHGMRDPAGLIGDFQQKVIVARKLLLSGGGLRPTQFFFLLGGIPLVLAYWKRVGDAPKLAAAIAASLGFASFLPTPTFGQYFCVLVPFLTLCLVESYGSAIVQASSSRIRGQLLGALVLFSMIYSMAALPRINSLFLRDEGVPGIGPFTGAIDWKIATVKQIAGVIESNTDEDSPVVSSWPGYLLEIDREIYPKMENQIAIDSSSKLVPKKADEFRMLREEDLPDAIVDKRVQVVVAGNCTHKRKALYRRVTGKEGYKLFSRIGDSEIYIRRFSAD